MRLNPFPKITLSDLLILIAAIGLGMASLRLTFDNSSRGWMLHKPTVLSYSSTPLPSFLEYNYFYIVVNTTPTLVAASLAIVLLTLRRRHLSSTPLRDRCGFILCLSAIVASVFAVSAYGLVYRYSNMDYPNFVCGAIVNGIVPDVGFMVMGAFLCQLLAGRWHPTSSHLDRAGFYLGFVWLILFALESFRWLLNSARLW